MAYDVAKACHRYIDNLPSSIRNMIFYRHPRVRYSLQRELMLLADRAVVSDDDLLSWEGARDHVLEMIQKTEPQIRKHHFSPTRYAPLVNSFQQLWQYKKDSIAQFKQVINQYKATCFQKDPLEFDTWSYILALVQIKKAIIAIHPQSKVDIDEQISRLNCHLKETLSHDRFSRFSVLHFSYENAYPTLIRQGLLSFELQDEWGYTPLLLAITANQVD